MGENWVICSRTLTDAQKPYGNVSILRPSATMRSLLMGRWARRRRYPLTVDSIPRAGGNHNFTLLFVIKLVKTWHPIYQTAHLHPGDRLLAKGFTGAYRRADWSTGEAQEQGIPSGPVNAAVVRKVVGHLQSTRCHMHLITYDKRPRGFRTHKTRDINLAV